MAKNKKVNFQDVQNPDGEVDRRAVIETQEAQEPAQDLPEPTPEELEAAVPHASPEVKLETVDKLEQLYGFLKDKDEERVKDIGMHRIHFHSIMELGERMAKAKKKGGEHPLSDGNIEVISQNHARLAKQGLL